MSTKSRGARRPRSAGLSNAMRAERRPDLDPFGRIPIRDHLSGRPHRPQKFAVYGPYLWVRHPLYFFVLLLIWSCPNLTLDRFIFNFLWTVWIIIGTVLEEKDLLSDFGDDYRQYQGRVPMLIPWKGRSNDFNSWNGGRTTRTN